MPFYLPRILRALVATLVLCGAPGAAADVSTPSADLSGVADLLDLDCARLLGFGGDRRDRPYVAVHARTFVTVANGVRTLIIRLNYARADDVDQVGVEWRVAADSVVVHEYAVPWDARSIDAIPTVPKGSKYFLIYRLVNGVFDGHVNTVGPNDRAKVLNAKVITTGVMAHWRPRINELLAIWVKGVNLKRLNELLAAEPTLDPLDAAFATWTGRLAHEFGFRRARLGLRGRHALVTAHRGHLPEFDVYFY